MNEKIRTVITTDGEIDDMNSFVRLLLYSNDLDIQAIVLTSSIFHYKGNDKKASFRWTGETWPLEIIDSYAKDFDNLKLHDPDYPTPEYLKSIYFIGNISDVSEMEEKSPGSEIIKDLILDNDERKLYLQVWGGSNTIARALKSIEEEYSNSEEWSKIKHKIESKVVIYMILDQDDTFKSYIQPNWKIRVISDDMNFGYFAYGWKNLPPEIKKYFEAAWFQKNILGKGELSKQYALIGDGKYLEGERETDQFSASNWPDIHPEFTRYNFISEGDSLAYLFLLQPNLAGIEDSTFGGWSGRYALTQENHYTSEAADYNPTTQRFEQEYGFIRWLADIQADFAARMNWTVATSYESANHYPVIQIEKNKIQARRGEMIKIHADVKDRNNLHLKFKWWCYYEISTYWNFKEIALEKEYFEFGDKKFPFSNHSEFVKKDWQLEMYDEDTDTVKIQIPEDAKKGETIHLIFEASNIYPTPLKSYQRIIITILE